MNATALHDGHRTMRGRHPSPAAVLLLVTGLFLAGCGERIAPGTAPPKRPAISGVSVATITPVAVDEFFEAAGTVKSSTTTAVAGRMMGTVTSLLVKEGDVVERGQLLLTIDDSDVAQKVRAAEAGHREAVKAREAAGQNRELTAITEQRYRRLFDEKALSRQEMDQFATRRKLAELEEERLQEMVDRTAAGLSEAKVYHGFTRVTSPVRGVVTEKRTEVGSMALPGVPLLMVEDGEVFHVEIAVDEGLTPILRKGAPVVVTVESLDRRIPGTIAEVLPAVDPQSRTFTVKVSLRSAGLRSGLYAKARIARGKREIVLVPKAAVVEKGQLTGVYAVDGQGVVTYRLVRLGQEFAGDREVLSGLKPQDRIIVQGVERAVDGGVIEPTGKK